MDGVPPGNVPPILLVLIYQCVPPLEVDRIGDLGVIFILNDIPSDFLLDNRLAPVIVEPRLLNFFLFGMSVEQRVLESGDVQINLEVDNMIVQGTH